tara:strand:- start:242 stop:958 length:717 start_codon:yes stop_codon:yes gene_type:complete
MSKNFKIVLAIIYLISLGLILFAFFKYVDITQLSNFSYIKEKSKFLIVLKDDNLILFTFLYLLFLIAWTLLLGFASPLAIVSGFVFGKAFGTIVSVLGFTFGCTLLYVFANFYFRDLIVNKLTPKISSFINLFNKNEFYYFMVFRLAGGGGTPFAIQNLLPVLFKMKVKNYFFSTLIGLCPTLFIWCAIGSGIEKMISKEINPSLIQIIQDKEIYLPILGFLLIIIFSFLLKKIYFKK